MLNDPTTLFGKVCTITLKKGGTLVRVVDDINTEGVHVHDEDGVKEVLPFDNIRHVRQKVR